MGWFRRHWALLLGTIGLVASIIKLLLYFVGRAGDLDFIISRISDPGWVRDMLTFLVSPLGNVILIVLGIALIWWDLRRTSNVSGSHGDSQGELYLHNHENLRDGSPKSYLISWSPIDHFDITFSDFESISRKWHHEIDVKEKAWTFFLTNVGPGPVRHVVITWEIIGINIQKLVIESGLFGVVTRSIDAGRIVAVNQDGHAFSKPIPTRSVSKIAKIYDGETMEIVPPKNFSTTWMVLALAETKNYNKNFEVSGDIWNAAKHENRIMTPIHVTIGYVNADGKSRNNSIRILAAIWPNVITRPLKPNKDGVYPLIKNATTAWVDNIQIVRD